MQRTSTHSPYYYYYYFIYFLCYCYYFSNIMLCITESVRCNGKEMMFNKYFISLYIWVCIRKPFSCLTSIVYTRIYFYFYFIFASKRGKRNIVSFPFLPSTFSHQSSFVWVYKLDIWKTTTPARRYIFFYKCTYKNNYCLIYI